MNRLVWLLAGRVGAVVVLALLSSSVNAWVIASDFEDGQAGQRANGNRAFSEAFSSTIYTSEQVHSGRMAARSSIRQGTHGGGEWGGIWNLPTKLQEGDEYWFRLWAYFPNDFSFSCGCPEGMKFMRTRILNGANVHEGYQNFFIGNKGLIVATSVNSQEFYDINHPYPFNDIRGIGRPITLGTWNAYEVYLKLSGVPGRGVFRAWQNGVMVFEDRATATMKSTQSRASAASVWTHWNNAAPRNQAAYIDDVVITNEPPAARDAHGNLYIGLGGDAQPVSVKAKLKPPSEVQVREVP